MGNGSGDTLAGQARAPGTSTLPPSAAHEINNPLDSLLNLLFLIESDAALSAKSQEYLRLAQEEVRRIAEIARNTLAEHRGGSVPEPADVGNLLNDVIDFYRQRFESSGIAVHTRYRSNGKIPAYTGQLREVFSNLLVNAQAAMPRGGDLQARVSATHEWSGQGRHGLRVTIADNGSGIPYDVRPRIFEAFFTTKRAGNGMGLSLVRDIVHRHHGWLRVRSSTKLGRSGTVFAIFLPAAA